MEGFFIEYRDPLFGIIVFLLLIVVLSLSSYFWTNFSTKRREDRLKNFAKRFEFAGLDHEVAWILKGDKKPVGSLLYLANAYENSGDHQRAIKIYLTLLEATKNPKDKTDIMERLGESYFRAGFLHRSRDLFLEVLRYYPRNEKALSHLIFVYDSLTEYSLALEALESLEELDEPVEKSKAYFNAQILTRGEQTEKTVRHEKVEENLVELIHKEPALARLVMGHFALHDSDAFWRTLPKINTDLCDLMDLFWRLDESKINYAIIPHFKVLSELYSARGLGNWATTSEIFELSVMMTLRRCGQSAKADLDFEYVCSECKQVFPLDQPRCPSCTALLSLECIPLLVESRHEENNSFQ